MNHERMLELINICDQPNIGFPADMNRDERREYIRITMDQIRKIHMELETGFFTVTTPVVTTPVQAP